MAIPVEMPKMSDTMVEGVLAAWLVDEGAKVSSGDVIAQVETDKATMDLEAYDDGVLLKKMVDAGGSVPIGGLIAVLGKEGEDIAAVLAKYGSGDGASASAAPAKAEAAVMLSAETLAAAAETPGDPTTLTLPADGGRVKASPLARSMAKEMGVDLSAVKGSGPEGRIVKRDVEAAQSAPAVAPAPVAAAPAPPRAATPSEGDEVRPNSSMRKAIARRLSESKFSAPHFYLTVDVDMEAASAFRGDLNVLAEKQGKAKVSFNDLITKACAVALRNHPYVNGSWSADAITLHQDVHVAIAVAMEDGLITPVVRHADRKGLAQIAEETRDLATRARDKKLAPDEFEGSTFTTSNLGMFGIAEFTSIINPPNVAILAIGAIRNVPVVKDGAVVPGKVMTLTLSCDHRVVDGAKGAAFLVDVQKYLEQPLTMLL
ncbi:MAG: pyruvate dehydrogenase complex dihydrolipoamide acetyltransferase [Rhodothermales bacterium]|nr:pyruvate dehydrogenase complex dihydrolipoamide acetyltransferase [Rhodothermales bacterium]